LKPENIQVGTFGEVIVCDWGLGKVVGDNDYDGGEFDRLLINQDLLNNMTLSGEIKGTPGFMAPEQIECAGSSEKTTATDIYALGAILYNILTEHIPVMGDSVDTVLKNTTVGEITPPIQRFPDLHIPHSLNSVVMKALALKPDERYESVNAMRNDIHNYLSGFATSAENAGILTELNLFYFRNRTVCHQACASIIIVIALTAWFMNNLNQSRLNAEQAQLHAEQLLSMYEQEKEKLKMSNLQRSEQFIQGSKSLAPQLYFDDPVKYTKTALWRLNNAIQVAPSNKRAFALIGLHNFTTQQFKRASKAFAEFPLYSEQMTMLSREWASEPKGDNHLLPLEKLTQLINDLKKKYHIDLCERIVVYDYAVRTNKNDYAPVVQALLSVLHDGSVPKQFTFKYEPTKRDLTIQGNGIHSLRSHEKLSSGKCLLRFLNIDSLNISHTKVHDLNEIAGLPGLKYLNVRHTQIKDLTPLTKMSSLIQLKITPGQFNEEQLNVLPKQIKVVTDQ